MSSKVIKLHYRCFFPFFFSFASFLFFCVFSSYWSYWSYFCCLFLITFQNRCYIKCSYFFGIQQCLQNQRICQIRYYTCQNQPNCRLRNYRCHHQDTINLAYIFNFLLEILLYQVTFFSLNFCFCFVTP